MLQLYVNDCTELCIYIQVQIDEIYVEVLLTIYFVSASIFRNCRVCMFFELAICLVN